MMRAVGEDEYRKDLQRSFPEGNPNLEIGRYGLGFAKDFNAKTKEDLLKLLITPSSERHFIMYEGT